ncbi:MAG: biotin/lipoyl-binding protein, partial [Rhodothermales bacterium]
MRILSSFLFTLTLIAFSLSNTSCSSDAQSKSPEEEEERPAVPVEAATVETGEIAAFYTGTASLEAEEEALVVAKTGGVAIEILAEEGQYVEEGQALVKLDDERLTLELSRAEAALSKLHRDYERNDELFQKNLISAVEYERVKSDYETQKAD